MDRPVLWCLPAGSRGCATAPQASKPPGKLEINGEPACTAPPAECDDGDHNGGESDVDCGGDDCDPCADGSGCRVSEDCASRVCRQRVCVAHDCGDGALNGDETDVDCGGSCSPCGPDGACGNGSDCRSRRCQDGSCSEPSCDDGIENGDESDVDCGGSDCGPCDDGDSCRDGFDCGSGTCNADEICYLPTCDDAIQNGTETSVDCGGERCDACPVGAGCVIADDCASGRCDVGVCGAAATCDDEEENGDESDVDCGGDECAPCPAGRRCYRNFDCVTRNCWGGTCGAFATCDDGLQNAAETGLDCGGPDCRPCADGEPCLRALDCDSSICADDVCAASTCEDERIAGLETDVDCGGPACPGCRAGASCRIGPDCESEICGDGTCIAPTCEDGVLNGDEVSVDCGGSCGDADHCRGACDPGLTVTDLTPFADDDGAVTLGGDWAGLGLSLVEAADRRCIGDPPAPEDVFLFTAPAAGLFLVQLDGPEGMGLHGRLGSCAEDALPAGCATGVAADLAVELEGGDDLYLFVEPVGDLSSTAYTLDVIPLVDICAGTPREFCPLSCGPLPLIDLVVDGFDGSASASGDVDGDSVLVIPDLCSDNPLFDGAETVLSYRSTRSGRYRAYARTTAPAALSIRDECLNSSPVRACEQADSAPEIAFDVAEGETVWLALEASRGVPFDFDFHVEHVYASCPDFEPCAVECDVEGEYPWIDLGLHCVDSGAEFNDVLGEGQSFFTPECGDATAEGFEVVHRFVAVDGGAHRFSVEGEFPVGLTVHDERCQPTAPVLGCTTSEDGPLAVDLTAGQVVFAVVDSLAGRGGAYTVTVGTP